MTIGPIPAAINLAELREPFAFPSVGVLWLHANIGEGGAVYAGNANTAAQLQFDRELGAMIRGDAAATQSDEAFYDGAQPPLGEAVLRVRRDAAGAVYFKWTGMTDEAAAVANTLGTATFTHLLAYSSTGSGIDAKIGEEHQLLGLRVESGELSPAGMAAIETDLFGYTL